MWGSCAMMVMERGLKGIASVPDHLMDVGVDDTNLRSLCDVSNVITRKNYAVRITVRVYPMRGR